MDIIILVYFNLWKTQCETCYYIHIIEIPNSKWANFTKFRK